MLARLLTSRSWEMETRTWLSQDSGLSVGCNLTDTYIYIPWSRRISPEGYPRNHSHSGEKSGVGGQGTRNLLFIYRLLILNVELLAFIYSTKKCWNNNLQWGQWRHHSFMNLMAQEIRCPVVIWLYHLANCHQWHSCSRTLITRGGSRTEFWKLFIC